MSEQRKSSFFGNEDIIILHGSDEPSIKKDIARIVDTSDGFADLNTTRLNAGEVSPSEISMQLNMLPMGIGKRKIILEHAQEKFRSKEDQEWFQSLLDNLPPSTQLILILDDQKKYQRGRVDWMKFKASHWLRESLKNYSGSKFWQEHPLPDAKQMPKWIKDKTIEIGGSIDPAAAHILANLVGIDLIQAEHEISKAVAYCGAGHQISVEDIRLLCAASKEENIFALVDAVGKRDGKDALRVFRELAIDSPPQYIFSMLVRQIRLLLQARFILDEKGTVKKLAEVCDLKSEWQAGKLMEQARQFTAADLEHIYRQLDGIDEDSKIGRISLDAAIEPLLASITSR